jgi:hypothetical protein
MLRMLRPQVVVEVTYMCGDGLVREREAVSHSPRWTNYRKLSV